MEEKKPYLAAILIQFLSAGMFISSKAAFNEGMSSFIFIFYRQAAGTIILIPLAIIFERKTASPLSFVTFCKIFMLSLVGITLALNANGIALVYTSSTLAASITNCLPVITFFLAVILRMEKLKLRTIPGAVKVAGIMLCLAGVATLAFYKGPYLKPFLHHHPFSSSHDLDHTLSGKRWMKGCFLMFISTICWALWIVFQARVLEDYSSKLMFTCLQCFLSAVQSFVVAIALERDSSQWKLGWNLRLVAVAYSASMVTGVGYYTQAWLLEKKGPVFQAMWTPLGLVITTFCSMFLLGEIISLGSVLGGILMVGSLYSVLWGKSKEQNLNRKELNNPDHLSDEPERDYLERKQVAIILKTTPPAMRV